MNKDNGNYGHPQPKKHPFRNNLHVSGIDKQRFERTESETENEQSIESDQHHAR